MQDASGSTAQLTMCLGHIVDSYLLDQVHDFAYEAACSLCATEHLVPSGPVVRLEQLAPLVREAARRHYDHDGFVLNGEQLQTPISAKDVAASLLSKAVEPAALEFTSEVAARFVGREKAWFVPFDQDHEADVHFEWDDFEQSVKHVTRLLAPPVGTTPTTPPERNYEFVRSLLVLAEERSGMARTLKRGTKLYRARSERDSRTLEEKVRLSPAGELGPAPAERVSAGRMNAQGVPMLYVALDGDTACAEVASHSPYDEAVVGTFILQQPVRILDLTRVPTKRSVFESAYEEGDHRLDSLNFYRDRITQPVILDDNHPVDYVPSQILTEAFRWWSTPQLDGIAFPSRVNPGGTNVVLFFGDQKWFEQVGTRSSRFLQFERENERGRSGPVFVIDPATVRRYEVRRTVSVTRRPGTADT
jgi:RES domain-containing protein